MLLLCSSSGNRSPLSLVSPLRLFLLSAATLIATGCASPGPPRPPSLNLSQPVTDLTAERVGDQVLLRWTAPTKTTDKLPLKGNLTARICRDAVPATPSVKPSSLPCTSVLRVAIHTGPGTATDTLPATLTSDPISLLDYRIEIENASGRTAGPSSEAFAAAGAAPPSVASLHATTVPTGARLEWQPLAPSPTPSATFIELDRLSPTLAASPSKPSPPPSPSRPQSKSTQPFQVGDKEPSEVHLRAGGIPPPTPGDGAPTGSQPDTIPEPLGTIDQTARFGETYRYTAQRVRIVRLKSRTLEIRSTPSDFITVTLHDTFPPATPTGLAAIPGEPSNAAAPSESVQPTSTHLASIDLSWEPNSEPDLAGYLVYRLPLSNPATPNTASQPTRLTPTALPGPAFRDLTATPGQRYAYTVTAIDTAGNESAPSTPVEEALPSSSRP